jgi:uncharacterized protein (TIGR02231 family)
MEKNHFHSHTSNPTLMKTKSAVLGFAFLMSAFLSHAEEKKTISNSDISGVKVFLSGAEITRTFKTNLPAGVTTLVVSDLSSQIDRSSITASCGSEAMILATSYEMDYLKETRVSPQMKVLKDSLEILSDNLNELNMMKSVYNEEIVMLNSNKTVGGSNTGVSQENLHKVIDFYRSRMIEIKTKLLDVDKKSAKVSERIRKIGDQINQENGRLNRPYGTILITVSAKQPVTANFELTYYSNGASWSPSYDIRSENAKGDVKLLYKANVSQNTGEDWRNVRISLSTGNPTLGGNKPELQPWFLRLAAIYQLDGYSSGRERKAPSPQTPDAAVMSEQQVYNKQEFKDVVVVQESQVVTEFEIQIPYTVMSDGKEVMMDIQSYNLPATYSYYSTPKMDKDAFLMASITGWEKFNLLPGQANVYLENSYVGESYINPAVTTDTLKLSFGRDKRIVIKRERVKDMNAQKFIGGNVEKEYMFETTIRNTKNVNVSVTIEDQLPLSTDENIKITNGELSGGNLKSETGMINWKFELKPGESKSIRLGYKVKYPKDRFIPGL